MVDIALQVVAGALADPKVLGADACKAPAKCPNPTDLGDGVDENDKAFSCTFPYLVATDSGFDSTIKRGYPLGSTPDGGLSYRGPHSGLNQNLSHHSMPTMNFTLTRPNLIKLFAIPLFVFAATLPRGEADRLTLREPPPRERVPARARRASPTRARPTTASAPCRRP